MTMPDAQLDDNQRVEPDIRPEPATEIRGSVPLPSIGSLTVVKTNAASSAAKASKGPTSIVRRARPARKTSRRSDKAAVRHPQLNPS